MPSPTPHLSEIKEKHADTLGVEYDRFAAGLEDHDDFAAFVASLAQGEENLISLPLANPRSHHQAMLKLNAPC